MFIQLFRLFLTFLLVLCIRGVSTAQAEIVIKCLSPTTQEVLDPPNVARGTVQYQYRCLPSDVSIAVDNQTSQMSLKAFLHLNWPVADASGRPDYEKYIGQPGYYDNSPVWEAWTTTTEIFDGGGKPPTPWGQTDQRLPASCAGLDVSAEKLKYSHRDSVPASLPPRYLEEAKDPQGHYVIDQDGEPLRYEVAVNEIAFNYIVGNTLYSAAGREKWTPPNKGQAGGKNGISLPPGIFHGAIPGTDLTGPVRGAIVAKAAWKVLTDKDDPQQFHKAWAYVRPLNKQGGLEDTCEFKAVGLIAMHITYKSKNLDNDWGWATFEHTCAAPHPNELQRQSTLQGAGNLASGSERCPNGWLFYNPTCQDDCLPVNQPPGPLPGTKPSQIVADWEPLYYCDLCKTFNAHANDIIKESVWANYQFVGTQWLDPSNDDKPSPAYLSSAILEAYLKPHTSCIACHDSAGFNGVKGTADSMFMFSSPPPKTKPKEK